MKKKILILIMCVCMIVPMFVFASFADAPPVYSSDYLLISFETGDTLSIVDGDYQQLLLNDSVVFVDGIQLGYFSQDYYLRYNPSSVSISSPTTSGEPLLFMNFPITSNVIQQGHSSANSFANGMTFNGRVDIYSSYNVAMDNLIEDFNDVGISVVVVHVSEPTNVLDLMFKGVTATSVGLANGIKESVSSLVYDYTPDGERVLSDFVIFVFVIAGLAIAMTVFWLVFRLIRFGRQR